MVKTGTEIKGRSKNLCKGRINRTWKLTWNKRWIHWGAKGDPGYHLQKQVIERHRIREWEEGGKITFENSLQCVLNVYYFSDIFLMLHYVCLFALLVSLISMIKQSIFLKCLSDTWKYKTISALMEIITFLRKEGQQMGDFGVDLCGDDGSIVTTL